MGWLSLLLGLVEEKGEWSSALRRLISDRIGVTRSSTA